MKYFFTFLAGTVVGAGGMLLWLRKDIRKQLNEIRTDSVEPEKSIKEDDGKDEKADTQQKDREVVARVISQPKEKKNYNEISRERLKQEEEKQMDLGEELDQELAEMPEAKKDPEFIPIDTDTFSHDHSYGKEQLVYYRGDKVMATESGTILEKPAMLVGVNWEETVGRYAQRTAFIRNEHLLTDYEIYVEDGLYSDEYGPDDYYRED